MKKPIILITPTHSDDRDRYYVSFDYADRILEAGGIPVILTMKLSEDDIKELLDNASGVLFSGGDDVHPAIWGESMHAGCGHMDPERDDLEMALYKEASKRNMPMLGICRGIQMMNVAAGGSIYQDIPSEFKLPADVIPVKHRQGMHSDIPTHYVNIKEGSLLESIFYDNGRENKPAASSAAYGFLDGTNRVLVNSFHHQACKDVAPGYHAVAFSDDGVIEAIENPSLKFALGVQWHPERLRPTDTTKKIFAAFVNKCK